MGLLAGARASGSGESTGRLRRKLSLQNVRDATLIVFTLVPGVMSLSDVSHGTAQLAQRSIAVVFGLLLVGRLTQLYRSGRNTRLTQELAVTQSQLKVTEGQLKTLRETVERVADKQTPLFEEELDITVFIGARDNEDRISERFYTRPDPQVIQRSFRPIVKIGEEIPRLEDLQLSSEIEDDESGQEARVIITPTPLREERGLLRTLLVFEPALVKPTKWRIDYSTPGMWAPLREENRDILRWANGLLKNGRQRPSISSLSVNFVFPTTARPLVTERHGKGQFLKPRIDAGLRIIEWRDVSPSESYEWTLRWNAPGPSDAGSPTNGGQTVNSDGDASSASSAGG